MTVKNIEVRVGRTYNLGRYESLRLDYSISMPIANDANAIEAMDLAADKLLTFVDRQALKMMKRIKAQRDDTSFK